MRDINLKNAIVKYLHKEGISSIKELKDDCINIKNKRKSLDDLIQNLKITIIKSNTHLLIDKIHRGEYESVLTILNNTRDRSVFFDFIDNLSSLVELFESYYQDYDLKHNELLKLKENLGLNDHILYKLLLEIIEEE